MASQRNQWALENQNSNGKLKCFKLRRYSWVLKPGLFFTKFIYPKFHHFSLTPPLPTLQATTMPCFCGSLLLLFASTVAPRLPIFPQNILFIASKPKNACPYHCQIWAPAAPLNHLCPRFRFAQPNVPATVILHTRVHAQSHMMHHPVLSIHAGLGQRLSCSIPRKYPVLPTLHFFFCLIFSHLALFYHLL